MPTMLHRSRFIRTPFTATRPKPVRAACLARAAVQNDDTRMPHHSVQYQRLVSALAALSLLAEPGECHVCGHAITALTLRPSSTSAFAARPEGVNRPELLPKGEVQTVIDVAGFLAPSEVRVVCLLPELPLSKERHFRRSILTTSSPMWQEARIKAQIEGIERDTGYKLRVRGWREEDEVQIFLM